MALSDLSLTLNPGDFVTVIGGNGAGKSTMLNMVAGVYPVDAGKILIDGVDVTALPEHKRAAYIGRVFQDPMLGTAADMWVEENLAIADRRGKKRGFKWAITKAEKEAYDLVFIDPPYAMDAAADAILRILEAGLLRPGALIETEAGRAGILPDLPRGLTLRRAARHSLSHVSLFVWEG